MELTERVEDINKRLVDLFGIDTATGDAMWRVSWSEDQFEHRLGTYEDITPAGLYLRTVTEVRYAPKYQHIDHKYILERLVAIPDCNENDLPAVKTSYELMWSFADKNDNPLPPKFEACQFIINLVYAAQYGNKKGVQRYIDPDYCQEAELENRKKRIDNIIEELFGDQSSLQGTTKTGESIIVPRNFERT